MILAAWLVTLAAAEGPPLFYWGARPALISLAAAPEPQAQAQVLELHAAQDARGLALRLTFDRPVGEALRLPDGTPVAGRLQAVLYCDVDGRRETGWDAGPADLRRGAEWRLEIGTLALGADPDERRGNEVLVTAALDALTGDGRRRALWRADSGAPEQLRTAGEWLELRLPRELWSDQAHARLILAAGGRALADARLPPP